MSAFKRWRSSAPVDPAAGPAAETPPAPQRRRSLQVTALLLVVAVAAIAAAVLIVRSSSSNSLFGSHPASAATAASAVTPALPATTLAALPKRSVKDGAKPLLVTLTAPVAPTSPAPMLQPKVAGSWTISGDSEIFTPASTLAPCTRYTLTVWADTTSTGHSRLGRRREIGLDVACPPVAGLQQALAHLGYLGAKFRPLYDVRIPSGAETRAEAASLAFDPPHGRLAPDPSDAPPVDMGTLDEATRGAITVYQAHHNLPETGEPDAALWSSILSSEARSRRDPEPYTWISVSESVPETLEVHRGHHVVFTTPANTGVPGAETEQGIFPIYARYISTTMSGTDVDGTKYKVPDVPWVNYFNGGDAVHGYPRASYGFPQSNGCVELPIEAAHTVFGMLRLGDIVWVT